MKRIMIQVSEVAAQSLAVLAARCTRANKRCEGFTSQAALNVSAMMAMLSEDAAMVISRQEGGRVPAWLRIQL